MFWTIDRFPPLVNGYSGLYTIRLARLLPFLPGFPDADSVRALEAYGVRTVVVHLELAAGTPYQDAATRPIGRLPLVRRQVGSLVIFDVT